MLRIVSGEGHRAEILAEIIRLANAAVAAQFDLNADNAAKHPSNCTAEWIDNDRERGIQYLVAELEGSPVGCVALERTKEETCYLERLAVLPDFQNRGIGSAMVEAFKALARDEEFTRISIGIIADHTALTAWYARRGFQPTKTRTFPHLPFTVQFMACSLTG